MATLNSSLPALPEYTLRALSPLVPGLADKYLALVLPILAYWLTSGFFHVIDEYDLFPQYRLHTPAEVLKRNHVSRYEVLRDVLLQQVVQTIFGVFLGIFEDDIQVGSEQYDVAVWAQRLRIAQRYIPSVLALAGLDAMGLSKNMAASHPVIAGLLAGGAVSLQQQDAVTVNVFLPWELLSAKFIYHIVVPAFQFALAILIVDTWQYFWHRAMHLNKWLYTTFHSRHHRLYVPYAYGALYNHPVEGFLLDTLGTGIGYLVSGMTPRQAMWFFTCSTIKTVDDHCGYSLPYDPLQHITSNNAGYHDVHHQSWGIKTNFSQPFFTFWDRLMGTMWAGGDVSARYERSRILAQRKVDADKPITGQPPATAPPGPYESPAEVVAPDSPQVSSLHILPKIPSGKALRQAAGGRRQVLDDADQPGGGGVSILREEIAEEIEAQQSIRRSPRKRTQTEKSGARADSPMS